nr:atherin-like [Aegilops tauschii subsp. strangulata]
MAPLYPSPRLAGRPRRFDAVPLPRVVVHRRLAGAARTAPPSPTPPRRPLSPSTLVRPRASALLCTRPPTPPPARPLPPGRATNPAVVRRWSVRAVPLPVCPHVGARPRHCSARATQRPAAIRARPATSRGRARTTVAIVVATPLSSILAITLSATAA